VAADGRPTYCYFGLALDIGARRIHKIPIAIDGNAGFLDPMGVHAVLAQRQ